MGRIDVDIDVCCSKALELKAAGSANASQPEKKGPAMAAAPGEEQHVEEPLVSWAETARTLAGKQAQELPKQPAADVGPIEALVLAFLDKIEQPRQVELVKQLLDPSGDHTMKRDPASCPTLRAANSLMEGLDFEVVRKLGKGSSRFTATLHMSGLCSGASSCVYEIRAGPRRCTITTKLSKAACSDCAYFSPLYHFITCALTVALSIIALHRPLYSLTSC